MNYPIPIFVFLNGLIKDPNTVNFFKHSSIHMFLHSSILFFLIMFLFLSLQHKIPSKNTPPLMGSILSLFFDVKPIPPQFQVFINFRGEKMRTQFVGFLVQEMKREKINVYTDEHELRGRKLTHLFTRIKQSRVAITIFTKDYTESDWCLNELAEIKECMDQGNLEAIPIFYQMKIDDVKKLKGRFGLNFKSLKYSHCNKQKWEDALRSIPRNFALCSSNYRYQTEFVKVIVEEVKKVLKDISDRENLKEEKFNNLRAIREEVIKKSAQCLTLFLLFTMFLGPYLLGLVSIFSILLSRSTINRVMVSERSEFYM